MSETRNDRFDYFKGILMFGVLFGHAINSYNVGGGVGVPLHALIRTYDMPFFMLISGLFFARSADRYVPWKNIVNKITSILVPLLLWNTLFYSIKCVVITLKGTGGFSMEALLRSLAGSWFLWSALICSCLMIVICGIWKSVWMRAIVSILISVLLLFLPFDPWHIAYMFPFYAIGFFLERVLARFTEKQTNILKSVSVALFVVLFCFWKTKYNIWNAGSYVLGGGLDTLFAVVFRFLIGCTGCVSASVVFDIFRKAENPVMSFINREFISVGKNTLTLYLLQGFVLEFLFARTIEILVQALNGNPFIANARLLAYVIAPVTAFVCMAVLNRMILLMKRIPLLGKYIFGFKALNAVKKTDCPKH